MKIQRTRGSAGVRAGMSMIEVAICIVIVAVLLLGTSMTLSADLKNSFQSREMTGGTFFLKTVLEDVSGQPFENLLALNGNLIFDVTNANDSRFSVSLAVTPVDINLVQVFAVLSDLRTGREIGRLSTLRSGT